MKKLKVPKGIELQSDFWGETNHHEWIKRHERLNQLVGIFGLIVLIVGQHFISLIIIGGFMVLISFLALIAKNKWSKQQDERKY